MLAPESGSSLPTPDEPPLQSDLLDAVAANERGGKRDQFGVVLTEHERENLVAEERQRKLDDIQRQQFENQQLMYGAQMNGMRPMMAGMGGMGAMGPWGMMGFNPIMGALDPQQQLQVLAAQRAATEAYQRTLLSFSQGRSTAPGPYDEAEPWY